MKIPPPTWSSTPRALAGLEGAIDCVLGVQGSAGPKLFLLDCPFL
jgi:hypothetical protein